MNQKIFNVLITFTIMFISTSIAFGQKSERSDYQLLWRIEGPKLKKPSYLFGTMHLNDERVFDFSDSVLVAFEKSEAFAIEVDLDSMMNYMINPKSAIWADTTNYLRKKLSAEEYEFVNNLLEKKLGYPINQLRNKSFWFVELLLNDSEEVLSKYQQENGIENKKESLFLDAYFHQKASMLKKKIFGLERIENQFLEKNNENMPYRKESFLEKLGYYETDTEPDGKDKALQLDEFVEAYYKGNLSFLEQYQDMFNNGTMTLRNNDMANSIDRIIRNKTLFAAVGAAHLPGKNGIINLLKRKGYRVTPVTASFTGVASAYKDRYADLKGYKLEKMLEGYSVIMPSIPLSYPVPNTNKSMYVCASEEKNTAAFALSLAITSREKSEVELMDQMLSKYTSTMGTIKGDVKNIELNGVNGREAFIKSNGTEFQVQIFAKNNKMYLFMHTLDKTNQKDAEEFFSSVKLFDVPVRAIAYKKINDTEDHLEITMPDDYSTGRIGNLRLEEEEDGMEVKSRPYRYFSATDENKKVSYVLRIDKVKEASYNLNDSTLMEQVKALVKNDSTAKELNSVTYLSGKFRGFKTKYQHKNNVISEIHQFPRGNRLYTILAQYDPQKSDTVAVMKFFQGFRILPVKNKALTTLAFSSDSSFSVKVPELLHKSVRNYTNSDFNAYTSIDSSSLSMYSVHEMVFAPYYWTSADSLYSNLRKNSLKESDKVLLEKKYTNDGNAVYDLVVEHGKSELQSFHRFIVTGKRLYEVSAIEPKEVLNKGYGLQFIGSFKLTNTGKDTLDLFKNKLSEVLAGLSSSDSTTIADAQMAFNYIVLSDADITLIRETLSQNKIKNDESKSRMLTALSTHVDSATLAIVKRLYFSAGSSSKFKATILKFLTEVGTNESFSVFEECAVNYKRDNEYPFSVMSYELKKKEEYQENFLPRLVKLAKASPDFLSVFVGYTSYDSIWNQPKFTQYKLEELIKPMGVAFDKLAPHFKKLPSTDSTYWSEYSQVNAYLEVFRKQHFAAKNVNRFKLFLADSSASLNKQAIIGLLNAGQKVKDTFFNKVLEDQYEGYYLLSDLEENKKIESVKHLLTQEKVCKIWLNYYLSEDYSVESVDFIRSTEVEAGDKKKRMFLFKCKLKEEDQIYYVIVGPQPIDSNSLEINPTTVEWLEESEEPTAEQTAILAKQYYEDSLKSE